MIPPAARAVRGDAKNGEKTGLRARLTACWRQIDGEWLIEHEHGSVPVELEKNEPAVNLEP